jgi:hypothetical protein
MNKHIEFVKEWLADNDCKTQEELEGNSYHANAADTAFTAYAFTAASNAAFFARVGDAEKAAEHVEFYEKLAQKEG